MRLPHLREEASVWLASLGLIGLVLLLASPWFGLPVLMLFLFVAFFFRDPDRHVEASPEAILAPADGQVIDVNEVFEERFLRQTATRVSIFLSLFDVHINRSPIEGRVTYLKYQKGRFWPAFRSEAIVENERNFMGLEGRQGRALVVQIAGILARRIVCQVSEGDALEAGQRFGMIRLGSRTDLILPKTSVEMLVSPGERVKAGETVIGRWVSS